MSDDPTTILDNPTALPEADDVIDAVIEASRAAFAAPTEHEVSASRDAEAVDHVDAVVLPVEYAGIDTRTAGGNYATRSNIVAP